MLQKQMNQLRLRARVLHHKILLKRLHQKLYHLKRKLIKLLLLPRLVIKPLKKKLKLLLKLKKSKRLQVQLNQRDLISQRDQNWELLLVEQVVKKLKH